MKASTRHLSTLFNLTEKEFIAVEMHSFINIMNVISLQLDLMKTYDSNNKYIQSIQKDFQSLFKKLKNHGKLSPEEVTSFKHCLFEALDELSSGYTDKEDLDETRDLLQDIFTVFNQRLEELEQINNMSFAWIEMSIDEFKKEFYDFLHVVEKNSRGRYHIVKNIANQTPEDYLVHFDVDSTFNDSIFMPLIFKDVIRDSIANARKYTPPGGTIIVGVKMDREKLRVVVKDYGIGIPENEIDRIFEFGYRASNVRNRETRGGGFGLTKALYVTTQCSGNIWIDSTLGVGTHLTFELPLPNSLLSTE